MMGLPRQRPVVNSAAQELVQHSGVRRNHAVPHAKECLIHPLTMAPPSDEALLELSNKISDLSEKLAE